MATDRPARLRASCWRLGRRPAHLDDRAAGADALVLVPALQPANPDDDGFAGLDNITTSSPTRPSGRRSSTRSSSSSACSSSPSSAASCSAAARPADLRPGHRAHPGDLAVLRHAAGRGAGVEEHDDAPELRRLRRHRANSSGSDRSTGSRTIRCSRSSSSSPGSGCRSRR